MQIEEAPKLLNKKWRMGLANGFIYTGMVIEVAGDSIILIDKFAERVTIRICDISSYAEVSNG